MTRRLELSVATPVVTLLRARMRRGRRNTFHRGGRPDRRGGRSARLSPPDVQRAHRRPRRRRHSSWCDVLGPAGHLRLPRGPHRAHPSDHQRAGARLPPPARDRQALRHARPGERRRLILGVGVGTLQEEFDLLGAPFEDRGARADDALRALRASLSTKEPAYDGALLLRRADSGSVRRAGAGADLGRRCAPCAHCADGSALADG